MLGGEVEDDAMVSVAQKCFVVALEASTPDLPLMPRSPSRPQCRATTAAQQGVEKTSKVLLGPGVADHPGDFAGRDIETGDQGLRAVAAILEFAPLDHARLHRQPRRDALQCLNAGHLVD